MRIRELAVEGALEITPTPVSDDRGLFVSTFQEAPFRLTSTARTVRRSMSSWISGSIRRPSASGMPWRPENELALSVLDPALDLPLPRELTPILSARDQGAPALDEALERGLLPHYDKCKAAEEALSH